ncbi:hypothetical protein [Dulcicalothrix desertica]|nr:hypothetical protein [Dulcicalothrix desertica]
MHKSISRKFFFWSSSAALLVFSAACNTAQPRVFTLWKTGA